MFQLGHFIRIMCLDTEGWYKNQRKIDLWLENRHNEFGLVNFHVSSKKSKNLYFDWLLLSNTYKDLDEKVLKS